MLQHRERSEWARCSSLMSLVANAFAARGKKFKPADFDPFSKLDRRQAGKVSVEVFGAMMGFQRKDSDATSRNAGGPGRPYQRGGV